MKLATQFAVLIEKRRRPAAWGWMLASLALLFGLLSHQVASAGATSSGRNQHVVRDLDEMRAPAARPLAAAAGPDSVSTDGRAQEPAPKCRHPA